MSIFTFKPPIRRQTTTSPAGTKAISLQAACAAANSGRDRLSSHLYLQAAYTAANVEVSVVEIVEATSSRLYGGKLSSMGVAISFDLQAACSAENHLRLGNTATATLQAA